MSSSDSSFSSSAASSSAAASPPAAAPLAPPAAEPAAGPAAWNPDKISFKSLPSRACAKTLAHTLSMEAPAALATVAKFSAETSMPASARMKAAYEMIASDMVQLRCSLVVTLWRPGLASCVFLYLVDAQWVAVCVGSWMKRSRRDGARARRHEKVFAP